MSTEPRTVFRTGPVQVTVWGNPSDKDLVAWFRWYERRGTPSAIIRDRKKEAVESSVSVWRHGDDTRLYPDKIKPWFEVVKECNGFSRLISGKEGG